MKRHACWIAVLMAVSVAAAQERQAPSQAWSVSGETYKQFQVKLTPGNAPDLSTPHGCVEAFNALAVGSPVAWARLAEIELHIDDVIENELKPGLEGLAQPLRAVPRAAAAKPAGHDIAWTLHEPKSDQLPWNDDAPEKLPGDVVVVAITAGGGSSNPGGGETHYAYLCRQDDDGQWRIAGLREKRRRPPREVILPADPERGGVRTEHRVTPDWVDVDPGFARFAAARAIVATPDKAAGIEAAVRGVLDDVLIGRLSFRALMVQRVLGAWLDALKPLMTPELVTRLETAAADTKPFALPTFEVLDVRDAGVVVRMDDEARSQWLFECEEADGRWVVTGVKRRFVSTRVRDGAEIERLEPVESIWKVVSQAPLTINAAGLYLRE